MNRFSFHFLDLRRSLASFFLNLLAMFGFRPHSPFTRHSLTLRFVGFALMFKAFFRYRTRHRYRYRYIFGSLLLLVISIDF